MKEKRKKKYRFLRKSQDFHAYLRISLKDFFFLAVEDAIANTESTSLPLSKSSVNFGPSSLPNTPQQKYSPWLSILSLRVFPVAILVGSKTIKYSLL